MNTAQSETRQASPRAGLIVMKTLMTALVITAAREYARWCYGDSLQQAQYIVHGMIERPYVYRALIPWAAKFFTLFGLREDTALSLAIILSAVALLYGIDQLAGLVMRRA